MLNLMFQTETMISVTRLERKIFVKPRASLHPLCLHVRSRRPRFAMCTDDESNLELEISTLEAHLQKLREQLNQQKRLKESRLSVRANFLRFV
jgi:hypothetical protein